MEFSNNTLPCDVALLAGRVVVNEALLTGESMPVVKEGLLTVPKDDWNKNFDPKCNTGKQHMLLAGTTLLQTVTVDRLDDNTAQHTHTHNVDVEENDDYDEIVQNKQINQNKQIQKDSNYYNQFNNPLINTINSSKYICPDGGCPAFVTRTGFSTTQGKLLRAIIFLSDATSTNTAESFFFMMFMIVIASITAWYVFTHVDNTQMTPFQLYIRVIQIITIIIPSDLHTSISFIINMANISLQKVGIFCTEPFRIPNAGKIDTICFDKTGTLTEDKLIVEGIVTDLNYSSKKKNEQQQDNNNTNNNINNNFGLKPVNECPDETIFVLTGCHSLSLLGDDPKILRNGKVRQLLDDKELLENMSNNIKFNTNSAKQQSQTNQKTVGDPLEIVAFEATGWSICNAYTRSYQQLAKHGSRVIALSYKRIQAQSLSNLVSIPRKEVEKDLIFAGFLVLSCPLRSEAKRTVKNLMRSDHQCVIVTGDNAFTSISVAKEVGIVKNEKNLIIFNPDNKKWERNYDEEKDEDVDQRWL
ncbi:MAG: putative Manganese-transporting ATPase [Streblomastix strix]|uniref:Putative Manganese-transporting ATPase n=1 Tax=Streblomastix strix TaxID=222440 RepID=A0A5J4W650_9EUKA|nr:MAG: putative Manganese-transporting ATPase [Streblomastix strix]